MPVNSCPIFFFCGVTRTIEQPGWASHAQLFVAKNSSSIYYFFSYISVSFALDRYRLCYILFDQLYGRLNYRERGELRVRRPVYWHSSSKLLALRPACSYSSSSFDQTDGRRANLTPTAGHGAGFCLLYGWPIGRRTFLQTNLDLCAGPA